MEKQTSVAIAGMQHFESARERLATSVLRLPKSLKSYDIVMPNFLLEVGVTGMILLAHLRQEIPLRLELFKASLEIVFWLLWKKRRQVNLNKSTVEKIPVLLRN